ncbi:hypothetical protein [uncultured Nocardioides sp.]|uniref:hypothetical protein n=1 Tax=uncultured Nocardioides sp. TaxID=198441 RepID=UPI000C4BAE21|nr:hypothetical protein [Nocardioides sp.]
MRTTVKLGLGTLAGAVGAGLLTLPSSAVADDSFWKREDDRTDVVMSVDDDDDDDTGKDTNTKNTNTKNTKNTNNTNNTRDSRDTSGVDSRDGTNSRVTAVSRDRDRSRGDKTRDWTRDGGDRTRDRSANSTNDKSRNDTRR